MGRPPSSNLAVDRPALAAEWHPSLNDALTPADVSCWTRRSVWWQCPEGHDYRARIASRSNGLRCPRCQSLAWVNPVLAAEWHPSRNGDLTAWDVKSHSSQRVWWCCQAGHEWKVSIDNRANGRGCAQCSGHITSTGRVRGTLQEQAPEIAAEWHPTKNGALQPSGVFSHSGRMVWWRCVHGHAWEAQIKSRVTQHTKCGQCSGRAATPERNLRTQAPASADLWHPTRNERLTPDDVTSGSDRVVWWRCANGHEWQGKVSDRVRAPRCPECQLVHRSMMEVRIEFEVSAFFKVADDHKVEVAGGRVERVDMVLPDERVVVEYDGARYHHGRSREDHEKSERLRSAGWTVIRIREAPLRPLAATDVVGNARDPLVNAAATARCRFVHLRAPQPCGRVHARRPIPRPGRRVGFREQRVEAESSDPRRRVSSRLGLPYLWPSVAGARVPPGGQRQGVSCLRTFLAWSAQAKARAKSLGRESRSCCGVAPIPESWRQPIWRRAW
jgi:hypothetical protein